MRRLVGAAAAVGLALASIPSPAAAATDQWATWGPIQGVSTNYTTVMEQQAAGFPVAQVATDSRSNVQVASGSSVFLGAGTPPGAEFGSSRNQPYLVLRSRGDTAATPSTTVYTFERPTPEAGWAFVLGDVDADQVRVSATDAQGRPVPPTTIDTWFAGTFNHAGGVDVPSWDSTTSTLTGNTDARDTDGASGWFRPDIALSSLTLTFTRRAGLPVYQTWFVSRAKPIGGTVTDTSASGSCPIEDSTLTLVSPHGDTVATTRPDASGAYGFGDVATQAGYTVRVQAPPACVVPGSAERVVSNVGPDDDAASRADFAMRAIVPQPISGRVTDDRGAPVPGAVITVARPDGSTAVTTTDADGRYLVDDNPLGTGYRVSLAVPDGYGPGPGGAIRDGIEIASAPVTDQDFVVSSLPLVAGVVTAGGMPLPGVQVTLTSSDGAISTVTSTGPDGGYEFDGVPNGTYTVAITAPPGYSGVTTRQVNVTDENVTGQDFSLGRLGTISGQVSRTDGTVVTAAQVLVEGPGGSQTVSTDAEGRYVVDQLAPGTYRLTIQPEPGWTVEGPTTREVVITDAGEVLENEDFVVAADVAPEPEPSPPPSPEEPSPGPDDDANGDRMDDDDQYAESLADAGGPGAAWVPVGLLALVAGAGAVLRSRRR